MQPMPENLMLLKERIDEAEQREEIIEALGELAPLLVVHPSSREYYSVLVDAFQALRILTSEQEIDGEHVILLYLLDYLEIDSDGTEIQKNAGRQLRDCLEDWIAQYPEREAAVLRVHILEALLPRFQIRPSSALCWTFSRIGSRDERVVKLLWEYALVHDDETAEAALATLAGLGVPSSERMQVLELVHRKMQRRVTQPLLIALDRLADPASVDAVRETCFLPRPTEQIVVSDGMKWFALHVLAGIADANADDEQLQDRIWVFIAELYVLDPQNMIHPVNLGRGIAPRCDSRQVVPTILTWLGQAQDEEKRQQSLPVLSYRLEECVRPRQLAGWQQDQFPTTLRVLRQAACQDTGFTGRYATREMHVKEAAWGTLLRMGHAEALEWFEEAVSRETNLYVRGKLCDLFACFCLESLVSKVLAWILERYDAHLPDATGQVGGEISLRLGAVKVAQSAASPQAFDALLACGLTVNGQPLLASVEALADVACTRARKGERNSITERLVKTVVHNTEATHRLAAARALEAVAGEQEIPAFLLYPLVDVLLKEADRDTFERSILLSTFALPQQLPDALIPQVKQWAQERDDELALQSFSLLAERGWLLREKGLMKRLGLPLNEAEEGESRLLIRSDWRTHIIGLLYLTYPEQFASFVAELIKTLPWASAVQLLGKLRTSSEAREIQHEVSLALIERVKQRQTQMSAEIDLIHMTATLIPEQFAYEPWDLFWQEWLPDARAALADALGLIEKLPDSAHLQRVRLLQKLVGDGDYVVRRAAFRGLQVCAAALLQQWCWTWAWSEEPSLRWRAAEACAWLLPEGEQGTTYEKIFELLQTDLELEVRQTVLRTQQERRKRLWAQEYLTRVIQLIQTTSPSNEAVLAAWPYIEALKHVGDDTTMRTLRTFLGDVKLPSHVRHMYQLLLKKTDEGWKKAMKKWPHAAVTWAGSLEVGQGEIMTSAGRSIVGQYVVWRDDALTLRDAGSWGGTFQTTEDLRQYFDERLYLRTEDGRRGEILLKETNGPGGTSRFIGKGGIPV